MSAGGPFLREALPSDAVAVRRLLVESFGSFALPFTVYRSPLSEAFLSDRFDRCRGRAEERSLVLIHENSVCGFMASRMLGQVGFLEYVAVSVDRQGRGLGDMLLGVHHDWSRSLSAVSTSLDVFETNSRAARWYLSRGYRNVGVSYSYRLSTREVAMQGPELDVSDVDLRTALCQEGRFGVSRLNCSLGGRPISLGLFGQVACRVLDFGGCAAGPVIGAVARRFSPCRPEIVVTGAAEPWSLPGILGQERVLRLQRIEESSR